MVRASSILWRVPVIKFRKGGLPSSGAPSPAPVAAAPAPAAAAPAAAPAPAPASSLGSCAFGQKQQAAAMSTGPTLPDIDLPLKYKRAPLTDEEIDHINGGGIESPIATKGSNKFPKIIRLPKGLNLHVNKIKLKVT